MSLAWSRVKDDRELKGIILLELVYEQSVKANWVKRLVLGGLDAYGDVTWIESRQVIIAVAFDIAHSRTRQSEIGLNRGRLIINWIYE